MKGVIRIHFKLKKHGFCNPHFRLDFHPVLYEKIDINPIMPTSSITYRILEWTHHIVCTLHPMQRFRVSVVLGKILYFLFPIRKKVAMQNLKKAFPSKSQYWVNKTVFQCYYFYTWNLFQFISLPQSYSETKWHVAGQDVVDDILSHNRGAILVTGHFGSWELLGSWFGAHGYLVASIVQKQRNRGAHHFFNRQRGAFGMIQIDRKATSREMTDVLKDNYILSLLSDQDARKQGVFVDFFRQPSSTPKGVAIFHYRSKAPIIFATCYQLSYNEYAVEFKEVKPPERRSVQALTQSFTTMLEEKIKEYPGQYFWFHKRWKTTPE